ncbi:hypothetical protein [Asaia sp. HN010]|uniref:hypothetical protein n=1 Tax=Asaia sp. HN010 TaxID=3081233 RepID=UPI00301B6036
MLREQRKCKIAFLMNEDALEDEKRATFRKHLEKVVDTFIVFDRTCDEALNICIEGVDDVSTQIRRNVKLLNITNIRVIKKIERWVRHTEKILIDFDPLIIQQAISTVVIAGWSILQPYEAPTIDFLRSSLSSKNRDLNGGEKKWKDILINYGNYTSDNLDNELIEGLSVGYFKEESILKYANILNKNIKLGKNNNALRDAWNLYRSDLSLDDEMIADKLTEAALINAENISLPDLNAIVKFLKEYRFFDQANHLIQVFGEIIQKNPDLAKKAHGRLFVGEKLDPELLQVLEACKKEVVISRDPIERLNALAVNRNYDLEEDIEIISRITKDEWRTLVYTRDERLENMLNCARYLACQPEAEILRNNLDAVLAEVAARSPLRRDRLIKWGALPPDVEK